MRYHANLKLGLITASLLDFLAVVFSFSNPSQGYELSIYKSTPILTWVFLLISFWIGIIILIYLIYQKKYETDRLWILSLFIIFITRLSLIYIPYIRGYYCWAGDHVTHIGYIKDILLNGQIPITTNIYPISHLLIVEITYLSGLPSHNIVNYIVGFFSLFFMLSIYLVICRITPDRGAQLLSFAVIGGVIFNSYEVYFMPNGLSILYMPFFFAIVFRSKMEYKILALIIATIYPFFHPISSIMVIIFLTLKGIISAISYINENDKVNYHIVRSLFPLTLISIISITLMQWLLSFKIFGRSVERIYLAITADQNPDIIAQMGATLNKIDIHGIDFIELAIKTMGQNIIFIILSCLFILIFIKYNIKGIKVKNFYIIVSFFISASILYLFYLFSLIPGLAVIEASRMVTYAELFTSIFVTLALYTSFYIKNKVLIIVISLVIIISGIISFFSLYLSPYILCPTPHITSMEIYGAQWLLNEKDISLGYIYILSPLKRYADSIIGVNETKNRLNFGMAIPDHFNYSSNDRFGCNYKKNVYAYLTKFDKTIYTTVWEKVGRFNLDDFFKLANDPSVDKIYFNGECDSWYIRAQKR